MNKNRIRQSSGLTPWAGGIADNLWQMGDFFIDDLFRLPNQNVPAVNIRQESDCFILELAAPGLKKEDFEINLEPGLLRVRAQHQDQKESIDEKFTRKEFSYDSFERIFHLPENIDQKTAKANYDNSVLRISMIKTKVNVKSQRLINVS